MNAVAMYLIVIIIAVLACAVYVLRRGKKDGVHTVPPRAAAAHPIQVPREQYDRLMADEPEDLVIDRQPRAQREFTTKLDEPPVDTGPDTVSWAMSPSRPHTNDRHCLVCGAKPGEPCRTLSTGKPTHIHAARMRD